MAQFPSNIRFNLTTEDMSVKICQLLESRTPNSVPIEFTQKRLDTFPSHMIKMGKDGKMKFNIGKEYSDEVATRDFTQEIGAMILRITDGITYELSSHLSAYDKKVDKVLVYGFFGKMEHLVHKRDEDKKKDVISFFLKEPFLLYGFSVSNCMDVSK